MSSFTIVGELVRRYEIIVEAEDYDAADAKAGELEDTIIKSLSEDLESEVLSKMLKAGWIGLNDNNILSTDFEIIEIFELEK